MFKELFEGIQKAFVSNELLQQTYQQEFLRACLRINNSSTPGSSLDSPDVNAVGGGALQGISNN
ncbi:hypothetical protein [Wolbachia endosymbiont of Pentidionis agamae]|uniref:hypothetical protein n=1 Tax=Wolbachia endosymbiont of Pentidionis agamae TaxID=3110435 RepID=UPI002FD6C0E2